MKEITNQKKLETLKAYLLEMGHANPEELEDLTVENCFNDSCNTFEVVGNEYKILTDEEADEAAHDAIINELWAFNADFILRHTEFYNNSCDREDAEFIRAIQMLQSSICEGINSIVKALIVDIDEFITDAIDADGRGHFISWYDVREHEQNDLFIYRTN